MINKKTPKLEPFIQQSTPQERLIILQDIYNQMEFKPDTNQNRMECKYYMDEINEIIKIYPELSNTIKLKYYGF